jgi:hypothetical protein
MTEIRTEKHSYLLVIDYKSDFEYETRIIVAETAIEAYLLALERKMNVFTINCRDHD